MHEDRGECLVFWRLAFHPTYERELIRSAILTCLQAHGVRSTIAYELFGAHDLLLRVWVPESSNANAIEGDLLNALAGHDLRDVEIFTVSYPVRHWPFKREGFAFYWPEPADIRNLLSEEQITSIDDGTAPTDVIERAENQGVLRRYAAPEDPNLPGIKFAMVVRGGGNLSHSDLYSFEAALKNLLDAADRIDQRSLYAGEGFGHFLVMGNVDYERFHALNEQLLVPFNAAIVREEFSARTFTHLSGQRGFLISRERLSGPAVSPGVREAAASVVSDDGRVSVSALVPGYIFAGRFRIERFVGHGGFGLVYEVFDYEARQPRALKIFDSLDASALAREITFLQTIDHPNVVKAFGGDRAENLLYLVEEFVDGDTLHDHMQSSTPPDDSQSIRITVVLLDALAALHPEYERIAELRAKEVESGLEPEELDEYLRLKSEGIVHRDVKPKNILLRRPNLEPVLVDFNIASKVGDRVETTKHTQAYTPLDFASEAVWDTSIDLFAMGVVAYELLCRKHPYPDCDPRLPGPVDPATHRDDLPESMQQWLLRATAPARSDRYRTARQMQAALQAAAADLLPPT
jgi:hypothetical protein